MSPKPITKNTLFYGDNLPILREHIADESVDLIYLDPPFNSSRSYNVLFRDESGQEPDAQITAFEDTWHWNATAEATYHELITEGPNHVATAVNALRTIIGTNQMLAYLVMMAARLVELHRVLKPTGSLYLHCDSTASHYLKIILDTVFGVQNFRNEIVWKRQSAHSDAKSRFADVSDIILFYAKSRDTKFYPQYIDHDPNYVKKNYRFNDNDGRGYYRLADMASPNPRPNLMYKWLGFDFPTKGWRYKLETMQKLHEDGRIYYPRDKSGNYDLTKRPSLKRYLGEQEGSIVTNIWDDIHPLHSSHAERLGYPTQKPVELLERILQASSNPDDVVLDPFCGCGTTIAAAQKLGRRWIGIDITHLSVALQKYRLEQQFPGITFDVIGEPEDIGSARKLANDDKYQFQWWALSLVRARPLGGDAGSKQGKKGMDRGVDGVINVVEENTGKLKRILVQVKGGHVKSGDVRDLRGTVEREEGIIGVFITLEKPTREMITEAVSAGFYVTPFTGQKYPKIQLVTIEDLLANRRPELPATYGTFKEAPRIEADTGERQGKLF